MDPKLLFWTAALLNLAVLVGFAFLSWWSGHAERREVVAQVELAPLLEKNRRELRQSPRTPRPAKVVPLFPRR